MPSYLVDIFIANASAQMLKQTDTSINHSARIIPLDSATLLKNADVISNMQFANNSNFPDGSYTGSNFAMSQFRFEIKGLVFDSTVLFRFRYRYTRDPITQSVDNISHAVDMAFIDINVSPKVSLAFGKIPIYWPIFNLNSLTSGFQTEISSLNSDL